MESGGGQWHRGRFWGAEDIQRMYELGKALRGGCAGDERDGDTRGVKRCGESRKGMSRRWRPHRGEHTG